MTTHNTNLCYNHENMSNEAVPREAVPRSSAEFKLELGNELDNENIIHNMRQKTHMGQKLENHDKCKRDNIKKPEMASKNSIIQQTKTFSDETTMHGLSHVFTAKSTSRKIIWIVILVFAFSASVFYISSRLANYLSYSASSTSRKYFDNKEHVLKFPAVTVCSNNPFMLSRNGRKGQLMGEIMEEFLLPIGVNESFIPPSEEFSVRNNSPIEQKRKKRSTANSTEEPSEQPIFTNLNFALWLGEATERFDWIDSVLNWPEHAWLITELYNLTFVHKKLNDIKILFDNYHDHTIDTRVLFARQMSDLVNLEVRSELEGSCDEDQDKFKANVQENMISVFEISLFLKRFQEPKNGPAPF